jgi:hypothetical protein
VQHFRSLLPAVIVESKAGLGGASKFDFQFQPKLPEDCEIKNLKFVDAPASGIKFGRRPVESILVLLLLMYCSVVVSVSVGVSKIVWSSML